MSDRITVQAHMFDNIEKLSGIGLVQHSFLLSFRPSTIALFIASLLLFAGHLCASAANCAGDNPLSFDSGWSFLRAEAPGPEASGFDDTAWRPLDLPHDWSIEDLPSTNGAPSGPFNPALSAGGASTGYSSAPLAGIASISPCLLPIPSTNAADWLQPIQGEALAFKAHHAGPADGLVFRPLYEIHHQRYSVYW